MKHHPLASICCLREEEYAGYSRLARVVTSLLGLYTLRVAAQFTHDYYAQLINEGQTECDMACSIANHVVTKMGQWIVDLICGRKL